jgi:hypothetical protein
LTIGVSWDRPIAEIIVQRNQYPALSNSNFEDLCVICPRHAKFDNSTDVVTRRAQVGGYIGIDTRQRVTPAKFFFRRIPVFTFSVFHIPAQKFSCLPSGSFPSIFLPINIPAFFLRAGNIPVSEIARAHDEPRHVAQHQHDPASHTGCVAVQRKGWQNDGGQNDDGTATGPKAGRWNGGG